MNTWFIVIALLALALLCLRNRQKSRSPRTRAVDSPRIPDSFSWLYVSETDALSWQKTFYRQLPVGAYSSAPINQHLNGWCGACWLVAPLQVVQDSLNIREAPAHPNERDHRLFRFNLQAAAEAITGIHAPNVAKEETVGISISGPNRLWTACMGGDPMVALNAMQQGKLSLRMLFGEDQQSLMAVAFKEHTANGQNSYVRRVTALDTVNVERLKHAVWQSPVVLGIRAEPLWKVDLRGIVKEPSSGPRDHVASVIGWKTIDGAEYWIVRNSWGNTAKSNVYKKPDDVRECVKPGQICKTQHDEWSNGADMPGHILVPTSPELNIAGIYDEPTNWYQVHVQ